MIDGQMGSQPLNGSDARALLGIVWEWIANVNDGYGYDTDNLINDLRSAGYGPLPDREETT